MKPAPFDYHAPDTIDERRPAARRARRRQGPRRRPEPHPDAGPAPRRVRAPRRPPPRRRAARHRAPRRRACGSAPAPRRPRSSATPRSPARARCWPGPTPLIGHFQIRNRGTIGGSLAHADPAAEYPAVALALDAELEAVSVRGPADDPGGGLLHRHCGPPRSDDDELLTGVTFPVWTGRCGFAVEEFARRHGDFAIAGAGVAVELDGDDRVGRCAIGLFGLGSTPVRATAAEQSVVGVAASDVDPVGARSARGRRPGVRSRPTSTGPPTTADAGRRRRSSAARVATRDRGGAA